MPLLGALGLLFAEIVVLSGGLAWTFRRAQLPVGLLGALGLAMVVGVAQAALAIVVQAGIDVASGQAPFASVLAHRLLQVHGASVTVAMLAVCFAAPLALQRFLRLDARWTRALSRELLAGVVASSIGAIAVAGGTLIVGLLVAAILSSF